VKQSVHRMPKQEGEISAFEGISGNAIDRSESNLK
jgi:hypothetical protein